MSTTRFPNGVTNVVSENTLGQMGQLDPSKFHSYFNDFDTYLASDWTITNVGTTPSQALTAGDGGLLLLTEAATDDSSTFMQLKVASFLPAAGKKMFFKIRCQLSDATQSDMIFGLCGTDTSPLDDTDGIFFQKDDGDTHLDVYVKKDSTTGQNVALDIAEVTTAMTSYGFYFDGSDTVAFFINDVLIKKLDASAAYLPDANLAVLFGVQNGEAVAKTLTVDYIFAAKER